jgi:hypothetical protein
VIEYIVIGLLLALVGVLIYTNINLLNKLEVYEDWVGMFKGEVEKVYFRLKATDEKNLFEKDDDVGFVFSEILRITEEFNRKVK